jgi:hypothetical protein
MFELGSHPVGRALGPMIYGGWRNRFAAIRPIRLNKLRVLDNWANSVENVVQVVNVGVE